MKLFASLFLLCALVGSALAASSTTSIDYGTAATTEAATTVASATTLAPAASSSPPCGPQGPCGLLKCLGGGGGCGQKLYIFN